MSDYQFEWDAAKAAYNWKTHRISFEEAATVFEDPHAALQTDEPHSDNELREWIIGYSNKHRLLLVVFIEPEPYRIRIISARKPTARERNIYE